MALTLETHLVEAYIVSRKLRFAGSPVTLARLSQMWQMGVEPGAPFLNEDTLQRIAKYLRMTVTDLILAARKMAPPPPPPAPEPLVSATLEAPELPAPITVTSSAPAAIYVPEPTQVIPRTQLDELRQASREAPERDSAPEIVISFDDVETDVEADSESTAAAVVAPSAEQSAAVSTAPRAATSSKKKRSSKNKKSR